MSKEEILEGNKLIAKFMGAEVSQAYSKTKEQDGVMFYYPKDSSPDMFRNLSSASIKYHSSWDWLMPVYIKIAKEEKLWGDYEKSIIIFNIMYDRLGDAEGIDKVYESVVEFIKWYNQNTKPLNNE